ncbi:hypothetical protein JL722_2874 [Aureococcus anophagefferens]|nr:hypothetical protein JL722_2874 [Aureococcus anophagefferens]
MSLARNGRGGKRDRAAFEALTLGAMLTYDHSTGAGDDTVNYYRPHFTANCDSRRGHSGMDVFEKALDSARVNWLSYAPDGSDCEFVKDYATAACSATAKEVVEMKRTQSIARRLLAHDVARRRRAAAEVKIDGDFNGLREQLCVDVGFGQAERDKIGYHGPGLPDDNPRCALLGHEDCPEHLAVMEAYRASKKRSNRGVDGLKKIFRDKLGPEGIKRVLSARFPRLREVPHVLGPRDHPMNMFLDFGPLNCHFADFRNMAGKSDYYSRAVMVPCGEWLKICLTAMVRAVKVA